MTRVVVDAFLFANEWQMAELRYLTLRDHVDAFVPVACAYTHQGAPTDLSCVQPPAALGDSRYHLPRIVRPFRTYTDGQRSIAGQPLFQMIERQHRALVRQAVQDSVPRIDGDDVVCVSDVDEIPDPSALTVAIQLLDSYGGAIVFQQRWHCDRMRFLHPHSPWLGTTISKFSECLPQRHRDLRGPLHDAGRLVQEAGWHLSWFGTNEERTRKLHTFSHGEHVEDGADMSVARMRGEDVHGVQLIAVYPGDLTWPEPIEDGTFTVPDAWR